MEDAPAFSKDLTFLTEDSVKKLDQWRNRKDLITIGVVTYGQDYLLKTLINSFKAQISKNWKMVILHDGPISKDLYLSLVNDKYLADERIVLLTTESRYNDYGHSLRNIIIEKYLNSEWLLLTNGDNYYTPNFTQNMKNEISKDKDIALVACPCILQKTDPMKPELRLNYVNNPTIQIGHIDMGQFIVKTSFAKKFKLNPTAIADGEFCVQCVAAIKKEGKKIYRTYSIDFIHNN
jgi:hypothetical protein|tara:strand:+ start:37432 stop:38136 length:705 start_codon:yes stop_codon:yes gene_type:complete